MNERTSGRIPPAGKNRLFFEKSPYLLQHADNPVDWYPWGEDAFGRARREDKPIFLSIGYSTCHWCHVMEHESFEDDDVAALMNRAFVCVKVDREERPDVDNIYMTVCQLTTGSGGWPLTIIMSPAGEPFFAATYIPRYGMMRLIPQVEEAWKNDRGTILEDATRLREFVRESVARERGEALNEEDLHRTFRQLADRYDASYGGFGDAPKFPTPHNIMFLLRYWKRTGDAGALAMVEQTLERMRRGGIYDHVGFGFHRYSTDQRWLVPHFEKMLYDQALLVLAYTEAFQATGNETYRRTAEEIITYVLRDLSHESGGFFTAEDADSEGEEGKFYLWTAPEIRALLGPDDAQFVFDLCGAEESGNWTEQSSGRRPGTNILHLAKPIAECAVACGLDENATRERWESIRVRLFDARVRRVRPHRDDKVLADWNGLMIAALARAASAFGEPRYADRARAAAEFVLKRMAQEDGGVLHRYREGEASISGMVDDYAFMVWGLLELYQTTFEVTHLRSAVALADYTIAHFCDAASGGLFFTSDRGEELLVRSQAAYDGAVPSGNSVFMMNLFRLAHLTARTDYEERGRDIGRAFQDQASRMPVAFTFMMSALDFALGPTFEIVIVGERSGEGTRRMISELGRRFLPRAVVVLKRPGEARQLAEIAPYTGPHAAIDGRATAFVCRGHACELPTTDVARMLDLIGEGDSSPR